MTRPLFGLLITLVAVAPAVAQEDLSGEWRVSGTFTPSEGEPVDAKAKLFLTRVEGDRYTILRETRLRDGLRIVDQHGVAVRDGDRLMVSYRRAHGMVRGLEGYASQGASIADYTVRDGRIGGWSLAPGDEGKYEESGAVHDPGAVAEPTTVEASATRRELPELTGNVTIDAPNPGNYLVGQTIPLVVSPSTAELDVTGPAYVEPEGLFLSAPGTVTITASHGDETSRTVTLQVVPVDIVEVTVLGGYPISDAPPPHWKRPLGEEHPRWEPAAIQKDTPLKLAVKLAAPADLSQPTTLRLSVKSDNGSLWWKRRDVEISADVTLQELSGGQTVTVTSAVPLSPAVAVNALELEWELAGREIAETELRVYTVVGPPVKSPTPRYAKGRGGGSIATKLHYELACTWANGATKNVGGAVRESIAYQIDNGYRHHVHWQDFEKTGFEPLIPHYAKGAPPPENYPELKALGMVLPDYGQRQISPVYYPPLEPKKEYEKYKHYRTNYGWWALDNPTHVGGRCDQQASLICDILGTVGIEARVYYLERRGLSKDKNGRPVRRFHKAENFDFFWNFHGVVAVKLEDGSTWFYDGTGSLPPERNQGSASELFRVGGPFIEKWGRWKYDDTGRVVPKQYEPDTYVGQYGKVTPGTYRGIGPEHGE